MDRAPAAAGSPAPWLLSLALVLAVGAMSTGGVLTRLAIAGPVDPLGAAFHRLLFAGVLLASWALLRHRDELRALPRRDAMALAGIGVVLALHFATWHTSLALTTVASSVVLVTMHPAIVGLLGLWLLREGPTRRGALGIALALAGAVLLVGGDYALSGQAAVGDALAFAGALCMAVYILGGRVHRARRSLPVYATVVYLSAAATLLLMALAAGEPMSGFGARDYGLLLALALGPQVLGHTVANWSLRWVPASIVSTAIVGEPIGAALLALLVLGEVPPALAAAGGAVILAGVYLVARGQRRSAS